MNIHDVSFAQSNCVFSSYPKTNAGDQNPSVADRREDMGNFRSVGVLITVQYRSVFVCGRVDIQNYSTRIKNDSCSQFVVVARDWIQRDKTRGIP